MTSHVCFFGVLDNGELVKELVKETQEFLHPYWFITGLHLRPLWSPLSLLRGSRPSWTTHILLIRDRPSSFSIVLPPLPVALEGLLPGRRGALGGLVLVSLRWLAGWLPQHSPKLTLALEAIIGTDWKRQPALESKPQVSRGQIKFDFPGHFTLYWESRKDGRK